MYAICVIVLKQGVLLNYLLLYYINNFTNKINYMCVIGDIVLKITFFSTGLCCISAVILTT